MKQRYLVVAHGVKDGKPYSSLNLIREGKKKDTNEPYAFLDSNAFMRESELIPLGTIVAYQTSRVSSTVSQEDDDEE